MRGRWNALAVAVALALGVPGGAGGEANESLGLAPTRSEHVVLEGEWARELVKGLGLERALPEEPAESDYFSLLCPEKAELVIGPGGRSIPEEWSYRVTAEAPRRRDATEPVRVTVTVPATALYELTVEGAGRQRWVIDRQVVGHLDLAPLGVAQAPAIVPLRAGPHELAAYLAPGARVERVELSAHRSLCIAPADGWRADRPLFYGALARTVVRAFDFERRLPEHDEERQTLQGERFDSATAGGARTRRRIGMPASGGAWASAVTSPAEFSWEFRLEKPRVVSVMARTHGVQPQLWSVDGRYQVSLHPDHINSGFNWDHVVTLPLASGEHTVRALVARGAGIDEIRLVSHRSDESDYVRVLEEIGFPAAASAVAVPRSEAHEIISAAEFTELSHGFQMRLAGDPSDRPLTLVDMAPEPYVSRPLSPLLPAEL